MISVTFTNDVENIVATEHLYQWDNGQKLSISGVGTTADIHFANKKSEKALVITPTVTSGAMEAPIPNSLLAEPYPIIAYVYVPSDDGARTLKTVTIAVEARKQPSDFVLDEDEGITTIETISQRVNEVLQNANNQINTSISDMQTDYTNFKNTIQGELADMVANTTIPNADTVDGLHANEIASNPNLLVNPDFKINQRGQTEYIGACYTVDHWYKNYAGTVSATGSGITLTNGTVVRQVVERYTQFMGQNMTLSIKINGVIHTSTFTYPNGTGVFLFFKNSDIQLSRYFSTTDWLVITALTDNVEIEWVKLEYGKNATLFTPPDPAMELLKIQAKDGTIHAKTADTANTAGTLATTPTNVCLRNISFGTAEPQVTDPSAEGYVAEGALYGQYV